MTSHVPSSIFRSNSSSFTLIQSELLAQDSVSSRTEPFRSDFGEDVEEREASESAALSEGVEEREASELAALSEGLKGREASDLAALSEGLERRGPSDSAALNEGRESRPDRDFFEVAEEGEPSKSAALSGTCVDLPYAESLLDLWIAMRKSDGTCFVMQKGCIYIMQHDQHRFADTSWSSDTDVIRVVW